jgi:hypothetical protein
VLMDAWVDVSRDKRPTQVTHRETVERMELSIESLRLGEIHMSISRLRYTHIRNIYKKRKTRQQSRLQRTVPSPTYSLMLALPHLRKSPPLPQPRSSTLPHMTRPRPELPPRVALSRNGMRPNFAMRTDLIQLLKFRRPMMGESSRARTPTSLRWLSRMGSQRRDE